jgi:hypothetical protein
MSRAWKDLQFKERFSSCDCQIGWHAPTAVLALGAYGAVEPRTTYNLPEDVLIIAAATF